MMRTVILLVVALGVAGGTALLARDWIASQQPVVVEAPVEEIKAKRILVAAGDLPTGTLLVESHVRWQPWPDESLSEAYMVEGEAPMEDMLGSVVRLRIAEGEPITAGRVVRPGERGFLAAVLNRGMRAVTVKINAASGVAGFAFPGDRVDVMLSHSVKFKFRTGDGKTNSREHRVGETVLQNVRVLAIDQDTDKSGEQPVVAKTATLEVTPQQAEVVAVVAKMGTLSLSLRPLRGDEPTPAEVGLERNPRQASFVPAGAIAPSASEDEEFTRPLPLGSKRSLSHTLDHQISGLITPPRAGVEDSFTVMRGRKSKNQDANAAEAKDARDVEESADEEETSAAVF